MSISNFITDKFKKFTAKVNRHNALKVTNSIPELPPVGTKNRISYFHKELKDIHLNTNGATINNPIIDSIYANQKYDIYITKITIVIADSDIKMHKFGNISQLTNGWSLIVNESSVDNFLYQNAQTNGHINARTGSGEIFGSGNDVNRMKEWTRFDNDALVVRLDIDKIIPGGIRLGMGTKDNIRSVIQDDLTTLDAFEIHFFGYRHVE